MKKINIFFHILVFIFLFLFININYANSLQIESIFVNTDTSQAYANLQYGDYYDNVNLKFYFKANNIPSQLNYLPLLFSPKIYGINYSGDLHLVDVLPSTYYNVHNTASQQYLFNNLFYLYPDYPAYVVQLDLRSIDNAYYTNAYAYVLVDSTLDIPDSILDPVDEEDDDLNDFEPPEEDFYLSGIEDIYIDEDEDSTYSFYINNNSSSNLEIVSVSIDDPTRLDIEDIEYDHIVYSNSQEKVDVSLQSDTVSSDYTGTFKIDVLARYNNSSDQEKEKIITYHIEDEDSENTGDCSDIDLEDLRFTLNDNSTSTKDLKIINTSNDYDFEIDQIEIEEHDLIESSILDYPEIVEEESTKYIELEFNTEDISYNKIINLDIDIEGELTRSNRDDKDCDLSKNLRITLEDNYSPGSYESSTKCSSIKIFAPNILQKEESIKNYNRSSGFYIFNNSNQKFNINSMHIRDNSSLADISKNYIEEQIFAKSYIPLNFDLQTYDAYSKQTSRAKIEISGIFEDGKICNSSSLYTYFDLTVFREEDLCGNIGVKNKIANSGSTNLEIFNNTNKDFFVEDYLITNKKDLEINIPTIQTTVNANSNKEISAGISSYGTMQLSISGRFENGETCSFSNTRSGTIISYNTYTDYSNQEQNFSESSCKVQLDSPGLFEIKSAVEDLSFSFINTTNKFGKIEIIGNGVVVSPSLFYLDGYDNFSKTISLANYNNPKSVFFKVKLNDCNTQVFFTNLSMDDQNISKIKVLSYPQEIRAYQEKNSIHLELENLYSTRKELLLKLSGFPSTWNYSSKNIYLNKRSKEDFYLDLKISKEDLNSNKSYNGYIEVYDNSYKLYSLPLEINLQDLKSKINVDYNLSSSEISDNTFVLDVFIKNDFLNTKNLILDFNFNNAKYIVEGDKTFSIGPDSNISKKYIIARLNKTNSKSEDLNFDLSIKNVDNNKILYAKNIDLIDKEDTPSALTGFIIFSSTFLYILLFVVLVIIVLFIFNNKSRKAKLNK